MASTISFQNISLSDPVFGSYHATPWEYEAPVSLGKKAITIGFRSALKVDQVSIKLSRSQRILSSSEVLKECVVKVVDPKTVVMSHIAGYAPFKMDMDRSSSQEVVLFRVKKKREQLTAE